MGKIDLGSANLPLMHGLGVSYQQHLFIKLLESNYDTVKHSGHGTVLGIGKYKYYLQENTEYLFLSDIPISVGISFFELEEFYESLMDIKFIDRYTNGPESSVNTTALYRFYLNLEDKNLTDDHIQPLTEIQEGYISYDNM